MLKNITLSAEEAMIWKARRKATEERKSLNKLFREWLSRYVGARNAGKHYETVMERLSHVQARRSFTRDEMNER